MALPLALSARFDVDNESLLNLTPNTPTSHLEITGFCETAPQPVAQQSMTGGDGGSYGLLVPRGWRRRAALKAAAIYTFEDPEYLLLFLISASTRGEKLTKVAFLSSSGFKISADSIAKILEDPSYSDTAHVSFNKPHDSFTYWLTVNSEFQPSLGQLDQVATFKVREQLMDDDAVKQTEISVTSLVDNAASNLDLTPIATVTLDGSLVSEAEEIKPSGRGSGGAWETRDPLVLPGLGQILKADIAGGAFFDFGLPGSALVCAVGKYSDGETVTRVAVWPTVGMRPSPRIIEILLTDARFTDKVLIKIPGPGPGIFNSVQVTSKFLRTGLGRETQFNAVFTLERLLI